MVISFGSVARSDEWFACKHDSSTGQFLWLRGKSTEPLEQPVFRSSATNPDLGTCLVGHDQLREAQGLRFCLHPLVFRSSDLQDSSKIPGYSDDLGRKSHFHDFAN